MTRLMPLLLAAVLVSGCSRAEKSARSVGSRESADASNAPTKEEEAPPEPDKQAAAPFDQGQAGGEKAPSRKPEEKIQRKIVYHGKTELVVEDFDEASEKLLAILKDHDGYVDKADTYGQPGQPQNGAWKLRVPVARFDYFRAAVRKLGELRRDSLQSDDVTDRYYDTRAAVANLEAREQALRKLYEEKIAGSKLSELLEVDRELTSVRAEINVLKGRMQRWDKDAAFATLDVTMHDRRGYVPPASPAFDTQLGRTFHASVSGLLATGKMIVLVVVAVAPWLMVVGVFALPVWLVRRRMRKPDEAPVSVQEAPPAPPTPG